MNRLLPRNTLRSMSIFSGLIGLVSPPHQGRNMSTQIRSYIPSNPDGPFPYTKADLTPLDPGNDAAFYAPSRFVTHIDDNAIISLKQYYDETLPAKGKILDFCSSWISHYPPRIFKAVEENDLEVLGTGMNEQELQRNPVLKAWTVQDLNEDPNVKLPDQSDVPLDASTCVVSIDYLTSPVEVLSSLRQQTKTGGTVHLAVSNRCFPNKAVGRWLQVSESERLGMVGDYLHWAGWSDIEIVTIVEPGLWIKDPLWVVRATSKS